MLVAMTVWDSTSPTERAACLLRIATTRGDRLFIGLLAAAYIHLAFIAVCERMDRLVGREEEPSIWFFVSMALLALIMRKG